jgi:hypothetical protein
MIPSPGTGAALRDDSDDWYRQALQNVLRRIAERHEAIDDGTG